MNKLKSFPLLLVMLLAFSTISMASSKSSIDKDANEALAKFYNEVQLARKSTHKFGALLESRLRTAARIWLINPETIPAGNHPEPRYIHPIIK